MKQLRPEEEFARVLIASALGVPTRQHDDGSLPRMFDLEIVYSDRPPAAVEVVAAADSESIELWNLVNSGERWVETGLQGGWMAFAVPTARAKGLRAGLPGFLSKLEADGVREVAVHAGRQNDRYQREACGLGITHVRQSETDFPGSIYLSLELPTERSGAMVGDNGNPLAEWIGVFLSASEQRDVLSKLGESGAQERHAFVFFPGFAAAPFAVSYLLMADDAPLPLQEPVLPRQVTHVWAASEWASGKAIYWSPENGWAGFEKPREGQRHHSEP